MIRLDQPTAERFAVLTLGHIGRLWPYKLDHVMAGPEDVRTPAELHPIFHGSFDWHSCVHGWWQLMSLARLFPTLAQADEIMGRADVMLTPAKVAGELATFSRPFAAGASRPYGRAWLLALHAELDGTHADALAPLARFMADSLARYFSVMTYPIRVGTHFNSAFAMLLTLDWAKRHDPALAELVSQRARAWFGEDRDAQAWEPGGDEFLSPTLIEALLMSHVLPAEAFRAWLDAFLPRAAAGQPVTLFTPAHVSDRTDSKIAHLDGLNLSRAWCWRGIAAVQGDRPLRQRAEDSAERHLAAALPHLAADYMGEHWLATYALLALGADET